MTRRSTGNVETLTGKYWMSLSLLVSGLAQLVEHTLMGGDTCSIHVIRNKVRSAAGEWLRRLTPVECERLQNVPDDYTNCVSDSRRYVMLGNGWTVDVIAHILSFINNN